MKCSDQISTILLHLFVIVMIVYPKAVSAYYEDPHQQFDMTKNKTNETKIIFVQADNVTKACDAESKRRGFGGFGFSVDACSFYNAFMTECTIITPKRANFHTIGHEVRHCLQGHWHN